jgi:hypothetical protein
MLTSIEGIYENGRVWLLEPLPGVVRARVVVTLLPEPAALPPAAAEPLAAAPTETRTGDPVVDDYRPRTDLGRDLLARRRAYVRGGGKLIGWEEIEAEVAERRGELVEE